MITAGQRLVQLAGRAGAAGELLRSLAAGSAAGQILVARSGLGLATAAEHLLADVTPRPSAWTWAGAPFVRPPRRRRDEVLWLTPH